MVLKLKTGLDLTFIPKWDQSSIFMGCFIVGVEVSYSKNHFIKVFSTIFTLTCFYLGNTDKWKKNPKPGIAMRRPSVAELVPICYHKR